MSNENPWGNFTPAIEDEEALKALQEIAENPQKGEQPVIDSSTTQENPWGNFTPAPEDDISLPVAQSQEVEGAVVDSPTEGLEEDGIHVKPLVLKPETDFLADIVAPTAISQDQKLNETEPNDETGADSLNSVNTEESVIENSAPILTDGEDVPGELVAQSPEVIEPEIVKPKSTSMADLVAQAVFSPDKKLDLPVVEDETGADSLMSDVLPNKAPEGPEEPLSVEVLPPAPEVHPVVLTEKPVDYDLNPEGESELTFVPGERIVIPVEVLNGENKSLFSKLSESAKNIFSKAYESTVRATGADIAMDKMQIAFNQSWADKSEKQAIELKGQIDDLDIKSGAIETAKKALEEVIEDMKANNSPGVEKYLLKVRDLDNERDAILNKRDIVQTKLEARDAKTKLFINERDRIADKVIDRYSEILKPMEAELENLQGLRDKLEYDTAVVEVKNDEQLERYKSLEQQKKLVEGSLKLLNKSDREIKKYVAGIDDELSEIASNVKKEKEDLARRGDEINKKIAAADEKANPYRDKKEQFVRIKSGRPILINMKTREKGPEFTGSEEVSSTSREESEAVEAGAEAVDESSKETTTTEKIPTVEKSKERQKISEFISTWNAYLQEKGIKSDSPEILNQKEFLKISKMVPSQEMAFKNFKTIIEKYYKLRKIQVDKFTAKITGFYESKIKAKK